MENQPEINPNIFANLNETQKELLGWYAGFVAQLDSVSNEEKHAKMASQWHEAHVAKAKEISNRIDILEGACTMCGISYDQIKAVQNKYFKGLRNHNKLSYVAYYE